MSMNYLGKLWWTGKGVGWENVPRRLLQAWRVRSGLLRRRLDPANFSEEVFQADCSTDLGDPSDLWRRRIEGFFPAVDKGSLVGVADEQTWNERVTEIAEKALNGEYLFFSRWFGRLGWAPNFNLDPVHGITWEAGKHWLQTARSGPPRHDIKLVWEPSRFSLGYYFARAYVRSGQDRFAKGFWEMFDAWVEQNPPQLSVAWGCGQEMTFRLMAMLFGASVTLTSASATPERLNKLSQLGWQTGKQLDININQARMQGNNHAISEAVGLWTVGLLFPEFRASARWRNRGRRILATEVGRQIFDDGSYVQHSLNYHRVMMDDLLWACVLAGRNDRPLQPAVMERLERATDWMLEMIDPMSGRASNYGANDGALVLPLSCCDYRDYRPVTQAAHYLLHRTRCFEPGPWDEKMLWLSGEESLGAPVRPHRRKSTFIAPVGGYYILRGSQSWVMTRCHTYRKRPSQPDMLHVDLWWRGKNILRDAGSYMYYCEEPWGSYFYSTAAHNTVQIDGQDQMTKGPKFLWFRWTRSKLRRFETSPGGRMGYFEGEHYAYGRPPGRAIHRRAICRIEDTYLIVDDVLGRGRHEVALRWRLFPSEWQQEKMLWRTQLDGEELGLGILTPDQISPTLACGQDAPTPEGWESLYYGEKQTVPTLICKGFVELPTELITIVGTGDQVAALVETTKLEGVDAHGQLFLERMEGKDLEEWVREFTGGVL